MKRPDTLAEKLEHWILFPLILAALTGLVGWVYTTGSRVAALEARQPTLEESLREIREDVREIRKWVVPLPAHK
jgi:hypothetical protein